MPYEFVGSTLIPSHVMDNDAEINAHYQNIRLAYMPAEMRPEHATDKPFALVDQYGGFTIKELTEAEASNLGFLLQWLWENDSERHNEKELYLRFEAEKKKAQEAKLAPIKEKFHEEVEIVSSMARSPLHTYKLPDGRKIG